MAHGFNLFVAIGVVIGSSHAVAKYSQIASHEAECSGAFAKLLRYSREHLDHSREIVQANAFQWRRGLKEYLYYMHGLRERLESIPKGGTWMDMGAGGAFALEDALRAHPEKQIGAIAFGVKKPDSEAARFKAMEVFKGFKYVEGEVEKVDFANLPKADIITDLYGAVSYSPNLKLVLQKSLGQLKEDGEMFIVVNQGAFNFKKGLFRGDGFIEFVRQIKGVELVGSEHYAEDLPIHTLRLRRTSGPIVIPEIELVRVRSGTPPIWTYRYRNEPK